MAAQGHHAAVHRDLNSACFAHGLTRQRILNPGRKIDRDGQCLEPDVVGNPQYTFKWSDHAFHSAPLLPYTTKFPSSCITASFPVVFAVTDDHRAPCPFQ